MRKESLHVGSEADIEHEMVWCFAVRSVSHTVSEEPSAAALLTKLTKRGVAFTTK